MLQLYLYALSEGVASLGQLPPGQDRPHEGESDRSQEEWGWARHKGGAEFCEYYTGEVGLLPGIALNCTQKALDEFLARQVGLYFATTTEPAGLVRAWQFNRQLPLALPQPLTFPGKFPLVASGDAGASGKKSFEEGASTPRPFSRNWICPPYSPPPTSNPVSHQAETTPTGTMPMEDQGEVSSSQEEPDPWFLPRPARLEAESSLPTPSA